MQEVNVTELWLIVESLQSELVLLRGNLTSSTSGVSTNADQLDTMGKEMNSLWLMLGTMFILREYCSCTLRYARYSSTLFDVTTGCFLTLGREPRRLYYPCVGRMFVPPS